MDINFKRQIMNDYSISEEDFDSTRHVFAANQVDESFMFYDKADFAVICTAGKVFMRSDNPELMEELKKNFKDYSGAWFAEAANMRKVDMILGEYGIEIDNFFPLMSFYDRKVLVKDFKFTRVNKETICDFRNKTKMAFAFDGDDRFGLRYNDCDKLIALAGASVSGKYLRDIGLEKFSFENRYKGLAASILRSLSLLLIEENENVSPITSTQFSHTRSINISIRAGFEMNLCIKGKRNK